MTIVVTGSTGMLGADLVPLLETDHAVFPLNRQDLDITNRGAAEETLRSRDPDLVVNCAAYTRVDKAEDEFADAFRVNGLGVHNLSLACSKLDIPLCHVSTDYVFDGKGRRPNTPFDATSPVNAYGETKLAGEKFIQWIMKQFYIIRTSWLYGRGGKNFVRSMLELSDKGEEIRVVTDQIGSPTWTVTLARGIKQIIESGIFGIHHVTDRAGQGISWFEFALEIVRLMGSSATIIPIASDEYPMRAARPTYSVLDTRSTEVSTGFRAPDWKSSLGQFLQTFRNQSPDASS